MINIQHIAFVSQKRIILAQKRQSKILITQKKTSGKPALGQASHDIKQLKQTPCQNQDQDDVPAQTPDADVTMSI